jgi:hypothetical protein
MPLRLCDVYRTRSTAARRSRRSVVKCCKAPVPPDVRMTATRSPGSSCVSTNFSRPFLKKTTLSIDIPRSSTTTARIRPARSGDARPLPSVRMARAAAAAAAVAGTAGAAGGVPGTDAAGWPVGATRT